MASSQAVLMCRSEYWTHIGRGMMADVAGKFFWYELMTGDPQAALAFYTGVLGWTSAPFDGDPGGGAYHVVTGAQGPVGGIMALPAQAVADGMTPGWLGYIGSADVDADVARLCGAGATERRAAEDIPGVGRFAVLGDPGGATFMLLKGAGPDDFPSASPMAPGHVGWHELYSGDFARDLDFYAGSLGWSLGEAMDMGEMGSYQLVSQTGGVDFSAMTGGIMPLPPMMPAPLWLFYFVVDDIDAAVARVTAGGGQVLNGPIEVPGGAWIIQATDPQGAMFALVGMRAVTSDGEG